MANQLRKSQYGDYVAVDEVNDGKIISTPIYLKKGSPKILEFFDTEDKRWFKAAVLFNGEKLECTDIDPDSMWKGMKWQDDVHELLKLFRLPKSK